MLFADALEETGMEPQMKEGSWDACSYVTACLMGLEVFDCIKRVTRYGCVSIFFGGGRDRLRWLLGFRVWDRSGSVIARRAWECGWLACREQGVWREVWLFSTSDGWRVW